MSVRVDLAAPMNRLMMPSRRMQNRQSILCQETLFGSYISLCVSSYSTVRRRWNEVGLFGRVQQEEHAYTDANMRRRIAFAEGYANWTEDDWARGMLSDETHFYLGHHGHEYVQRPVGAALDPKYTRKTEQLEGKVSLWGCICAGGLGHAELYVDSLNARKYQSILALNLVSSAHPSILAARSMVGSAGQCLPSHCQHKSSLVSQSAWH